MDRNDRQTQLRANNIILPPLTLLFEPINAIIELRRRFAPLSSPLPRISTLLKHRLNNVSRIRYLPSKSLAFREEQVGGITQPVWVRTQDLSAEEGVDGVGLCYSEPGFVAAYFIAEEDAG